MQSTSIRIFSPRRSSGATPSGSSASGDRRILDLPGLQRPVIRRAALPARERALPHLRRHAHRQPRARLLLHARRLRRAVDRLAHRQLCVGTRVPRVSLAVFALGAALAALGGVIGGGFLGVYPGADFEVLPYAFVVVIVGGLGSLPGAMVGSLLVGLLDNFGKALFPELSYFTLFAPMALILALRPTGLFGRA